MSDIQTESERMRHCLSHLDFIAGELSLLLTISNTRLIDGDTLEKDGIVTHRLSPLMHVPAI